MRTRIKICGITDAESALVAAECGADAVGFVFHSTSPRAIAPDEAFEIMGTLPPFVTTVGLFVDRTVDQFSEVEERCPTDFSQLHGKEPEDVVRQCGPRVIKAVRFDSSTIGEELRRWGGVDEVDAILIDGSSGGMGETFDWEALAAVVRELPEDRQRPLMLAGGLNAGNVAEAIRAVRPWAVDVSSGVESSPGVKDHTLIREFCRAVQRADTALADQPA